VHVACTGVVKATGIVECCWPHRLRKSDFSSGEQLVAVRDRLRTVGSLLLEYSILILECIVLEWLYKQSQSTLE